MAGQPPIAPAPGQIETPPRPERAAATVQTGLTVSKRWVLPPRQKPGRKPKPRDQPRKVAPAPPPVLKAPTPNSDVPVDDSCGLCVHENDGGCMCSEIGLRPSKSNPATPAGTATTPAATGPESNAPQSQNQQSRQSQGQQRAFQRIQPSSKPLPSFEYFEVKEAVPLRQRSVTNQANPFKRLEPAGQLVVSASTQLTEPGRTEEPFFEIKMTPADSCGFCTDKTPCLCSGEGITEVNQSEPSPRPPPAASSHPTHSPAPHPQPAASPVARPSPQSAAPQEANSGTSQSERGLPCCAACEKDPHSMLFCLGLSAAQPLKENTVSLPCNMAYKTLERHPKFAACDLGELMGQLQAADNKVGLQSINKALQFLANL